MKGKYKIVREEGNVGKQNQIMTMTVVTGGREIQTDWHTNGDTKSN